MAQTVAIEPVDVTDGVVEPSLEHDNNNINTVKHSSMFLENNVPMSPGVKPPGSPLTLGDSKRNLKPKTLDEAIETLKQNATPLTMTSVNFTSEADSPLPPLHGSKMTFSRHSSSAVQSPRENSENLACSALTCDIICNCDGTVYLTPSDLSCKLLTPDGILNEPSDARCSPFPVSANCVKFYCSSSFEDPAVLVYSVISAESTRGDASSHPHLVTCLPCRYRFGHVDQLISHANKVHNLSNLCNSYANSSAVIQQVGSSQQTTFHYLKFEERVSIDSILVRSSVEQTITNSSSSRRSSTVSTSPVLANKIISPSGLNGRRGGGGCDEHPDGGIECPKCDLVLGSTRSLGGT